ncbi:MAG: sugar ABC transporter ATP-binding protein [Peptococcaceae bacterium]|jgi:ABC-type sugar transport system ATPase subunit|nr:sugar ABC transporter ATP-binding protein [Peptococcaceae bacterium]
MALLEMKNVSKRFGNLMVLDNVDVELRSHETLAILGGNGAGKSTLMRILNGTYPYDAACSGQIILDGKEVYFSTARDAEEAGIVMIYQEINLQLDLNAAENIYMGIFPRSNLGSIDWKTVKRGAEDILQNLGVDIDVNIPVRSFGASMQQQICIARALVRKPKLLILDEPTSCLTETETVRLMETIRQLKRQGISSIYISHKLNEVMDIADRIVILRDGKNASAYEKADFDADRIVEDMIGRSISNMYPKVDKTLKEEALRIENFTVAHPYARNKNIMENASFFIRKGEVLGLAGLVGSGRSELLRAIFGAIPKHSGKVFIEGKECEIREPAQALRLGLGYLTEDRKLDGIISTMNIKENMTLAILKKLSRLQVMDHKQENAIAQQYAGSLNIKFRGINDGIMSLSGGNQQKVVLSKLLMSHLKILFLDEPTRGIDVGAKNEIYKIINDLAKEGMSIVIVSSELAELLEICDRFVILSKGTTRREMDKDEVTEHKVLHACSGLD